MHPEMPTGLLLKLRIDYLRCRGHTRSPLKGLRRYGQS
jgi:hypothetical protein